MVAAAQQHQVVEARRAAVGPVDDVVGVAASRGAAREAAACVARAQGAADRGGMVRVLRPTSRTCPAASWCITTTPRRTRGARRFRGNADRRDHLERAVGRQSPLAAAPPEASRAGRPDSGHRRPDIEAGGRGLGEPPKCVGPALAR